MRWLLSTPRHHADITSSATPGNRITRTSTIVSSRVFAVVARARAASTSGRAASTPISAIALATSASSVPIARATRDASSWRPSAQQPRVDRDERRRQHALAEQVLQQIRDAQRRAKRIRRERQAEVRATITRSRTSPAIRDSKMPSPTASAPPNRRCRGAASGIDRLSCATSMAARNPTPELGGMFEFPDGVSAASDRTDTRPRHRDSHRHRSPRSARACCGRAVAGRLDESPGSRRPDRASRRSAPRS